MSMFEDYASNYPLSGKQFAALEVIANSKDKGKPQTLDQVIERLPYETTKQSFQFVLRSLIKRGYVEKLDREKFDKKSRRFLQATPLGLHKLVTESLRNRDAADAKTCQLDEVAKTDRLLREIAEEFK